MEYRLILTSKAEQEIADATVWYESQKEGLGIKFYTHLFTYLDAIEQNPFIYSRKNTSFREAYIRKYPFVILYEEKGGKIEIYSVFHTSKDPKSRF